MIHGIGGGGLLLFTCQCILKTQSRKHRNKRKNTKKIEKRFTGNLNLEHIQQCQNSIDL